MNYKEILLDLGYSNIIENAKDFRTRPIYRDSDNGTVLKINKENGSFVDFARNISGSFEELVKMSLNLKDIGEAKQWIGTKGIYSSAPKLIVKPLIKMPKTFSKDTLTKLLPDHSYWINRGVSEETLKTFRGGVVREGKMKDRYVFPIFDHKQDLVGASGRDLISHPDSARPKWKHVGDKSDWKYPLAFNYQIIKKENKVILVESIGDMLALWDCGVKNTIVTFGLDVSVSIINLLLRYDIGKMYISFNNDSGKNFAGNEAANKAKTKLLKYFDSDQAQIALPTGKDFGDMTKEDIYSWKNQIK